MIRRFARPYAQALLKTAGDLDRAVATRDELRAFAAALAEVHALERMAANPAVPLDVKQRVVDQVASRTGAGDLARRFLGLLTRNYRLHHLPAILEAIDEALNRRLGIAVARVTTAQPIDEAERRRLQETLERIAGRKVDLKLDVDPALLAGFVAHMDSSLYDASLAGQLERMAEQLAGA